MDLTCPKCKSGDVKGIRSAPEFHQPHDVKVFVEDRLLSCTSCGYTDWGYRFKLGGTVVSHL